MQPLPNPNGGQSTFYSSYSSGKLQPLSNCMAINSQLPSSDDEDVTPDCSQLPSSRSSILANSSELGRSNLFVKNISRAVTEPMLERTFSTFGQILESRIDIRNGLRFGVAYVQFSTVDEANVAIDNLHNTRLCGHTIQVEHFRRPQKRKNFTNVFVKNLASHVTDSLLQTYFEEFGEVTSVVVKRNRRGRSLGHGFVDFLSHEAARNAISTVNRRKRTSISAPRRRLRCSRAQTKEERGAQKSLFASHIPSSWGKRKIEREFGRYGLLQSVSYRPDSQTAYINFRRASAARTAQREFVHFQANEGESRKIRVDFQKSGHVRRQETLAARQRSRQQRLEREMMEDLEFDVDDAVEEDRVQQRPMKMMGRRIRQNMKSEYYEPPPLLRSESESEEEEDLEPISYRFDGEEADDLEATQEEEEEQALTSEEEEEDLDEDSLDQRLAEKVRRTIRNQSLRVDFNVVEKLISDVQRSPLRLKQDYLSDPSLLLSLIRVEQRKAKNRRRRSKKKSNSILRRRRRRRRCEDEGRVERIGGLIITHLPKE